MEHRGRAPSNTRGVCCLALHILIDLPALLPNWWIASRHVERDLGSRSFSDRILYRKRVGNSGDRRRVDGGPPTQSHTDVLARVTKDRAVILAIYQSLVASTQRHSSHDHSGVLGQNNVAFWQFLDN